MLLVQKSEQYKWKHTDWQNSAPNSLLDWDWDLRLSFSSSFEIL